MANSKNPDDIIYDANDPILDAALRAQAWAELKRKNKKVEPTKKKTEAAAAVANTPLFDTSVIGNVDKIPVPSQEKNYGKTPEPLAPVQRVFDKFYRERDLGGIEREMKVAAQRLAREPSESNKDAYNSWKEAYGKTVALWESENGRKYNRIDVVKSKNPSTATTQNKVSGVNAATPTVPNVANLKTKSPMESRDAARSAGRNVAPAPAVASTAPQIKIDPNVINTYMASNPGATYDQAVAAMYGSLINPLAVNGANGPSGVPSRTVNVDKRVQTFTAQQLEGAATQYAQQLLGRALTANELASVTKFTNTEASKTPQVSRTVTNNSGTTSTSSTTSSGGIDEGQLIKSQIEQNPEYANYQKATTYFDSMLSALRGPVGGGI
jgi:hypothetical protein